jgi:hypothetical protein
MVAVATGFIPGFSISPATAVPARGCVHRIVRRPRMKLNTLLWRHVIFCASADDLETKSRAGGKSLATLSSLPLLL